MYFIPRNNAFYNYIAHTSVKRRYMATLFSVTAFAGICFYGVYVPLHKHIFLYKTECMRLQKQYEEISQLRKTGHEFLSLVEAQKKNIAEHAVADDKREEYCHKAMQFMVDAVAASDLVLTAYGSCKEKDKIWYKKDSANFVMTGNIEKIMSFLKTVQGSAQMITLYHVVLTRAHDDLFQLSCDVGVITIKK